MKRLFLSLCAAFACLGALAQYQQPGSASLYKPLSTWPFRFEEFQEGVVRTVKGNLLEYSSLNVSVIDGKLMYINKGTIMQADMLNVYTAQVGTEIYINIYGKLHRVLQEVEKGAIVDLTSVDMEEMGKTNIGYGISSSTASMRNTTLAGLGVDAATGVNGDSVPLSQAEQQKHNGSVLPLRQDTYFYVYRILVPATKRDVINAPGVNKADAKAFFKTTKVKWNNPATLVPVVDFLYEQFDKTNKSQQ